MTPEERAARIAIDLPIVMPQGMFRKCVLELTAQIITAENEALERAALWLDEQDKIERKCLGGADCHCKTFDDAAKHFRSLKHPEAARRRAEETP